MFGSEQSPKPITLAKQMAKNKDRADEINARQRDLQRRLQLEENQAFQCHRCNQSGNSLRLCQATTNQMETGQVLTEYIVKGIISTCEFLKGSIFRQSDKRLTKNYRIIFPKGLAIYYL